MPKRREENTILRCAKSQNSADLLYTVKEVGNQARV